MQGQRAAKAKGVANATGLWSMVKVSQLLDRGGEMMQDGDEKRFERENASAWTFQSSKVDTT